MRQLLSLLLVIVNLLGFSPLSHTAPASANTNGELTWQIGDGVYLLDDYGISSAYLIMGSERALVIDAGMGFDDFRRRAEEYAQGKPLAVALTHGHVDHAGAARQFETVYMHPADAEIAYQQWLPIRFFYTFFNQIFGSRKYSNARLVNNKSNVPSETMYIEDGHRIDLGDRVVTFRHTPGHTKGSGCYIDSKTGFLFAGDMAHTSVMLFFPESASVETYNRSLRTMYEFATAATEVHTGHSKEPLDIAVVQTLLTMTDTIVTEARANAPIFMFTQTSAVATQADGTKREVVLRYDKSRVFDK